MAFKMRTTRPEAGNKYYITKNNGGYSYAIKGNPTDAQNDVLSNCFSGETNYITEEGLKNFKNTVGTVQMVLNENHEFVPAEIKSFGQQQLYKVTLGNGSTFYATGNHRWVIEKAKTNGKKIREIKTTLELIPGKSRIPYNYAENNNILDETGILHGLVFGDGYKNNNCSTYKLELFGNKKELEKYIPEHIYDEEYSFKKVPPISKNNAYLRGFLAGLIATDGTITKDTFKISSINKEALIQIRDICYKIGVAIGGIYHEVRDIKLGKYEYKDHSIYYLTFRRRNIDELLLKSHDKAKLTSPRKLITTTVVKSVELTDRFEEVYCAVEPITHTITLENNILTGQCVGYAYGRFNEIGGYGYCKYLSPVNAERFPQYNNTGIPMGQTPKLGACMVWQGGPTLQSGDGVGHVAIVEKVISSTEVMTSESGWGSKNPFWTATRKKGNGNWGAGSGYKFLGFIYNPAVKDDDIVSDQYGFGPTNSPLVNYTQISPNRTSPRTHVIDTVTIHCVVGQCSVEALGGIFAPTSKQASSNYGIGPDGRIGMYVEEKDRSWCSSNWSNDDRAITIEVASDTTSPYKVTDKAYNALIKLLADICQRNNIKSLKWKADKSLIGHPEEQNMTVHRWFANKSCPGDYLYNKHYEIAEKVNELLGVEEDDDMTQERFNEMMDNYMKERAELDPSKWSAQARSWAESNGLINGDAQGRTMYKKYMTREEVITVLYRAMNKGN